MSTKSAIVHNLLVTYDDVGGGPVLCMLHGWMHDHRSFDSLAERLSDSFRIVRLDLPGFGKSEMPKEAWGVGEYADFLSSFLSKLNIKPHTLIGHSFGGRVLIKAVATKRIHSERMVLIASAGVTSRSSSRIRAYRVLAKFARLVMQVVPHGWAVFIRKSLYRSIGSEYADAGPLRQTFARVVGEDLTQDARAIQTPTLLVWGSNDVATPLTDGRRLAEVISGSKLFVIHGATHMVHQEHPDAVAAEIRMFFA